MNDLDLIRIVAEDLLFLRSDWDQDIDDASLRRSSPVLRRLIVEGDFGRAWRALGLAREPIITAPCLDALLGPASRADVSFAQAGGAHYQGMTIRGTTLYARALSPDEITRSYERTKTLEPRSFPLSHFRESPCIIIMGELILRRELILYIANKCGGAHWDPSRTESKEIERKFQSLDSATGQIALAGKAAPYHELLAIGQSLARSPDVGSYLARARDAT